MNGPLGGYVAASGMGLVLGLLGGGGSILSVPILVYLCHFSAVLASSYSLCIVGIASLFGAVHYARQGNVSYRTALTFGPPAVLGCVLARSVVLPSIPEQIGLTSGVVISRDLLILAGFAAVMLAAGVAMIRGGGERTLERSDKRAANKSATVKHTVLAAEGLLVGMLTGVVGAGGGFLIVPVLVILLGLPARVAVGTSLSIISAKSLLGLFADRLFWSDADFSFLFCFTVFAVAGVLLGNLVSGRVPTGLLRTGFGWFVVVAGVAILSKEIGALAYRS